MVASRDCHGFMKGPPIISEKPRCWSEQILEKKGPYARFGPNIMGQIPGLGQIRCPNIMRPI